MLAVTDVLITDYSSIFIDFLATGRPVLFYTPDLADYESSRGLYLPLRATGPARYAANSTSSSRRSSSSTPAATTTPRCCTRDAYAAARERYCADEDGGAADRIIDIVFRGKACRATTCSAASATDARRS